jgi:hypothetical protein
MKLATFTCALAASAALSGVLAAPASAAAQPFHDVETQQVTGQVFTCTSGDLTVTSGTITLRLHGLQDGAHIFHLSGVVVPHDVTLTDGRDTYVVSGAEAFGGKSTNPGDDFTIQFHEADHFVIRDASGAVFAKVQLVEHWTADHHSFTLNRGACLNPNG